MAYVNEKIIDVDIKKSTIYRSFMNNPIGEGDNTGERFGVRLFSNGEKESISGEKCVGYFIRPDGVTLVLDGTVSDNKAYVDLPPAAYAKTGKFTLAVKVYGQGNTNTVVMFDGTVVDTTTGEVADTAEVIPSLANFYGAIVRAEEAIDNIRSLTIEAELITGTRYSMNVTKE